MNNLFRNFVLFVFSLKMHVQVRIGGDELA